MLAIYTRLSKRDEESNSVSNQLREGKEFAQIHNFTDYQIYNEGEGVSGGALVENRPQLNQLIQDIKSGLITTVWFRDQNRLERSGRTLYEFSDVTKKYKTQVYLGNKLTDFEDVDTFNFKMIVSLFNEGKLKKQSQQTRKALHDNLKEGKTRGGILPYGYTTDSNKYVIIEEKERKVIERIFNDSLNGIGTNKIAENLNDEGEPTKYAKYGTGTLKIKHKDTGKITIKQKANTKWSGNTVRSIIKNECYKGIKHFGTDEERTTYDYPIIIEPDFWDEVNANFTNNKNNSGKKTEWKYLLKGLLECDRCNCNYNGRTKKDKSDHYYGCSSKRFKDKNCGNRAINIDFFDDFIWAIIQSQQLKQDIQQQILIGQSNTQLINLNNQLEQLNKDLKTYQKQKNNLIEAVAEGILSTEDIKNKKQSIETNIREVTLKIKAKTKEHQFLTNAEGKQKKLLEELDTLKDDIPFDIKQNAIRKIINRIYINSDLKSSNYEIRIVYNIPMWDGIYIINYGYSLQKQMHPIQDLPYTITELKPLKNVTWRKKSLNRIEKYQPKMKHKYILNTRFGQTASQIKNFTKHYNELINHDPRKADHN